MKLEVLVSCMHKTPEYILQVTKAQCDMLVINQTNEEFCIEREQTSETNVHFSYRFISTKERGLSRSRNMAIRESRGDICLICDDDEILESDIESRVVSAYVQYPETDVMLFQVANTGKSYRSKTFTAGYLGALHFSSWQISFRRSKVVENGILFDEKMGSGTGNGANEENAFLYACLDKGLKLRYVPIQIATMFETGDSQWFSGYNDKFFLDRGWAMRRYMGWFMACLYALEFAVVRHKIYHNETSFFRAIYLMFKGIFFKSQNV